ncbi:Bifunctional NAD(P)H-hydrate repair enzyme Nnr [Pseudoalteromonas sp. P1-9]|uniref:bifunctional ADP-dependent NAD(P)H-hydrate dehydratase/NAD(P)H-hydrate epimerase n=1 Tax=Pseudoalteromonas sp. P1-9 TaxID=1710354 RepID=UPI0006D6018E|nr:bifunctional ADP-dependent NAD(P)H-hydrate dehydratase/NAD(P)H-hydrate epimerase [Pseudoalteromonas sp. P1-9]KPV96609.1 Bifunctional NAD(P)H-hydrate repair enzyme Nnr [Pseudoalteromonas sp. P1-9]
MTPELTTNLPQFAYSAQQVKDNEAIVASQHNVEMYALMQQAAASVFQLLMLKYGNCDKVQVIAGGGNNGGDGYWVANYALQHELDVTVFSVKDVNQLAGDAKRAYLDYIKQGGKVVDSLDTSADVYIDALLGIGFCGELSSEYSDVINHINQQHKPIIAVDLPSGLNATTGEVAKACINANYTVSFISLKQGLLSGNAKQHVGNLYFAGLGLADAFIEYVKPLSKLVNYDALKASLPVRHINSYKQQLGHVLLIGGDKPMPGAIRIAAESCLRAGAGLVSVATHPENRAIVVQGRYELMVHAVDHATELEPLIEKADVCVIGPGLGLSNWSKTVWQAIEKVNKPIIIDADGLNLLAQKPINLAHMIITPHSGEASRLLGIPSSEIELNRFDSVSKLAKQYNAIALLKGVGSLVANSHHTVINTSGRASMASAGMGDCLSGIIAGLIAQGMPNFEAVQLAVNIHGRAAEIAEQQGKRGMLVSDLYPLIRKLVD